MMRQGVLVVAAAVSLSVSLSACSVEGGGSDSGGGGDYPSRAVEFTVPSEPGGSTDLITRGLAQSIEGPLGGDTVVVNKPGANGKIAGKDVFASTPDGHRVAVMPQSLFAIGPLIVDDPDAIQLDDMTIVAGLTVEDYVLAVPAQSPYQSLDDLLAADRVTYGTTGAGTGSQLSQALLFGTAGVNATPVPFDGGGPLLNALLGDKVNAGSLQIAEAYEQIEAGALRPLVVFAEERIEALPDVPTATEAGQPIVVDQRRFVAAPADLPDDVLEKLSAAIDEAVQSPEFTKLLADNYIGAWNVDGDAARTQVSESLEEFTALTEELGIDLNGES